MKSSKRRMRSAWDFKQAALRALRRLKGPYPNFDLHDAINAVKRLPLFTSKRR